MIVHQFKNALDKNTGKMRLWSTDKNPEYKNLQSAKGFLLYWPESVAKCQHLGRGVQLYTARTMCITKVRCP